MPKIKFAEEAYLDLKKLRAHHRSAILGAIERHLQAPTLHLGRKVKMLRLADGSVLFRLRVGEYRVFFDVETEARQIVVLSIRHKGRRTTEEIR